MRSYLKHYIDGAWVESEGGTRHEVIDPATEAPVTEITLGSTADVDKAVAAARRAFESFSRTSVEERIALIERVIEAYKTRAADMAEAISLEMGAPLSLAKTAQVGSGIGHLQSAAHALGEFQFEEQIGNSLVVHEPIGVVALITPWNWPLYQITAKLAPALAAGCTVVLKPSELSPLSALLLAQAIHDAGLPAGVFNLVNGTGPEVGAAMAAHPDVDMISITGSNRAGILVAQAAAATVKRVTQELGGKSPNVLLPDADFARVVPLGVMTAFRNVGQSCSAPTRMLVPRSRLDEVEKLAAETADAIVVGDPADETTMLGPLANRAQFERVQAMIQAGIDDGAKLLCGGLGRPQGLEHGFFAKPTIFSEVATSMRIAREEIFGPVLCIIPYDSVDEAVEIANDTLYGLGGHVQGGDVAQARAVALRIRTGQVHINHPAWDPNAPFGGYKRSGNGREYGEHGLSEFLETKSILGFG